MFLRFTSGVTPANLLVASMAAVPNIPATCQTLTRTGGLSCHRQTFNRLSYAGCLSICLSICPSVCLCVLSCHTRHATVVGDMDISSIQYLLKFSAKLTWQVKWGKHVSDVYLFTFNPRRQNSSSVTMCLLCSVCSIYFFTCQVHCCNDFEFFKRRIKVITSDFNFRARTLKYLLWMILIFFPFSFDLQQFISIMFCWF